MVAIRAAAGVAPPPSAAKLFTPLVSSCTGTGPSYSRMVSNWNLQPMGVSAFMTLKPDMVS